MADIRGTLLSVAVATGVVGVGCGLFRSGELAVAPLQVEIAAANRLNPDERGESLPTLVQIYQLKSATKLEAADFEQFYRSSKETLGTDVLQMEEVTISPGERVLRRVERDRSAKVLAAVALFRRPTGVSWRAIADLPSPTTRSELRFVAEGYRIERR